MAGTLLELVIHVPPYIFQNSSKEAMARVAPGFQSIFIVICGADITTEQRSRGPATLPLRGCSCSPCIAHPGVLFPAKIYPR